MAIDPNLLVLKPVSELETVNSPTTGSLLFYDGGDELKKTNVSDFYNAMQSAYLGIATTTTTPPATGAYWYRVDTAGTYTNFLSGGSPIVVTQDELNVYFINLSVVNGVATKSLSKKPIQDLPENAISYKINPDLTAGDEGYAFNGRGTLSILGGKMTWENGSFSDSGIVCYTNPMKGKHVIIVKLKVEIFGDGIFRILNQAVSLINDNNWHYYKTYSDFASDTTLFLCFNGFTDGINQKIIIDSINAFNIEDHSVLSSIKKSDESFIQNKIFGNSVQKNPFFLEGSTGYELNGLGTGRFIDNKLKWNNNGLSDSGFVVYATENLLGSYKIIAQIKVNIFGDGKLTLGNEHINLINDGQFHTYIVDFNTSANNNFFTMYNSSLVAQEVEISMLDIYKNEQKTIINSIDKEDNYSLPADVNLILNAGQSNSLGADASISTTEISPNFLRFEGGVYETATKFEPFKLNVGWSEPPTAGVAHSLNSLAIKQGFSFSDSKILFADSGIGGQTIETLTNDTTAYNKNITIITKGRDIAQESGKTFAVPFVLWTQGESNYMDNPTDYVAKFETLRNKLNADIKSITGQNFNPKWIFYQPSTINVVAPVIPAYLMMDDLTDCYLANPQYDKEYLDESGQFVHLKNTSSRKMGAEYGFVINQILTGKDYQCLKIKNISKAGKFINIEFSENVVVDNSIVNTIANHGFTIEGNTIDSITVKDNRATIKCSNSVVAGNVLKYAYNGTTTSGNNAGARGNIRGKDSQFINSDIGVIYRWLPHYIKVF